MKIIMRNVIENNWKTRGNLGSCFKNQESNVY